MTGVRLCSAAIALFWVLLFVGLATSVGPIIALACLGVLVLFSAIILGLIILASPRQSFPLSVEEAQSLNESLRHEVFSGHREGF